MSWYFLGGFSAYWIVPSGRARNHSGCSLDPGVVGRGLKSDVEGDLDVDGSGRLHEGAKIGQTAELRVDGGVATFGTTDCPRHARVRMRSILSCCWALS